MRARRHVTRDERRARLVARHHLARTATDVATAVRDLVAVHSSDPATPYLALWARVPAFTVADLDRALYEARSLWRLHAMRRTLFVVPTDRAPVFQAACGREIARGERRRLEAWVAQARGGDDTQPWLRAVEEATAAVLADGVARDTRELTAAVEELSLRVRVGSGRWASEVSLASRLLPLLAIDGDVVRARPAGTWRSSQYQWSDAGSWFDARLPDDPTVGSDSADAAAILSRWWLGAHGPATLTDLKWWTGWTVRATRAALAAIGAVEVDLDHQSSGWVLPDDVDAPTPASAGVALLPGLDPTVMGWKERDWYLGDHAGPLFDRNGNAGPTVWVEGRVVGGWGQRPDGEVVTRLLEDVGSDAADRVAAEAAALTAWCDGTVAFPRFPSPLGTELSRPA
ncbi:MAG: winged helix DNA-binding domain-containing protein [Egibacteraceae bacterium]